MNVYTSNAVTLAESWLTELGYDTLADYLAANPAELDETETDPQLDDSWDTM